MAWPRKYQPILRIYTPNQYIPAQKIKIPRQDYQKNPPEGIGHTLKRAVQLKDIKGKKIFLDRQTTLLLCKKIIL